MSWRRDVLSADATTVAATCSEDIAIGISPNMTVQLRFEQALARSTVIEVQIDGTSRRLPRATIPHAIGLAMLIIGRQNTDAIRDTQRAGCNLTFVGIQNPFKPVRCARARCNDPICCWGGRR